MQTNVLAVSFIVERHQSAIVPTKSNKTIHCVESLR